MAELYLATTSGPKGFKRRVVLKKILPQFADNQSFIEMFLTEARIAGQLSHPNLAQVYEVGEVDGTYFIAMEYVDGPNLRTVRNKARQAGRMLSPYLAARILAYACDGLGYAHEFQDPETGEPLRIIHRDISPDNIVISSTGAVKVLDFGIAKAASQDHTTKAGVVKGKIAYMAPEQLARKPMDHRADIYSLGVVLYELLAGARPYDGSNELALLQARVSGQPVVPLATRRPDLPGEICDIAQKALELDPDRRYASCRELQTELEHLLHQATLPIGTREIAQQVADLQAEPDWGKLPGSSQASAPPPAPQTPPPAAREGTTDSFRPPAPPAPASPTSASQETDPRPPPAAPRRSRLPIIAAAAVVLLALGGLTVRALLGSGQPVPPVAPRPAPPAPVAGTEPPPPPPQTPVEEKPKLVELTVETIPPGTVRVAGRQGPSPFTVEVPAGNTRIEAFNSKPRFSRVERARVPAVERHTVKIKIGTRLVTFRSLVTAHVFMDGQPVKWSQGDVTPIKVDVYEGTHEIRFACSNKKEDTREVTVSPSAEELSISGNCVQP
jgi:serine/threonine-protein kinase